MSRGRKQSMAAQTPPPEINEDQLRQDVIVTNEHAAHLNVISKRFGDGYLFDPVRVENEAKFFLNQASTSIFEAGRRLVLLREFHAHGEWTECLARLGMAPRAAQRLIQLAVKFDLPNASTSTHFEKLGKSKLIELAVLDDDEIKELADGGTVLNLTLDAIDKLGVSELRAALRAANEEKEAKDRLLAEKNTRLDELQSRPLASRTWDDQAKALIEESDALFVILQEQLARLMVVQQAMMTAEFGEADDVDRGLRACAIAFGDKLTRSAQMLSELRGMHDRTLGAFADDLDSQPVDYDQTKSTALSTLGEDGGPAGDPTLQ